MKKVPRIKQISSAFIYVNPPDTTVFVEGFGAWKQILLKHVSIDSKVRKYVSQRANLMPSKKSVDQMLQRELNFCQAKKP